MKQKNKLMLITAILLAFTTILTACQTTLSSEQVKATMESAVNATMTAMPTATTKPTATVIPTPVPTPTTAPVQYGPTNFPDNVDPLTGLAVSDPSILNRRPVMVKVSNFPRNARPHAGLSFADIVFSYSTGEGGSRFLALYYGQDAKQVGSIRSGRYIDRWLVSMYQGILAFVSADNKTLPIGGYPPITELEALYAQLGDRAITYGENNKAFFTTITNDPSDPNYVNRVMVNTADLSKYYAALPSATNTKPVLDGMAFSSIPPSGGVDGYEVTMQYHPTNLENWKYDAATNKYLRWIDSEDANSNITLIPLVDRDTNQQLAFSNVVIIWAHYATLNGDDSLHEVSLVGASGKMLLFRDGKEYEGKWKGANTSGPIQFFDSDGNPMQLQPGNTWITVSGGTSTVQQDTPGVWKVIFSK
jgi:hypothetical protein